MDDHREHVIQALEEAIPFMENRGYGGVAHIIYDALDLLKEQERQIIRLKEKLRLLEYGNQDAAQITIMPAT